MTVASEAANRVILFDGPLQSMSSCFRSLLLLSLSGNCIRNGGEIQMHPDDLIMMAPLRATQTLQDDGRGYAGPPFGGNENANPKKNRT